MFKFSIQNPCQGWPGQPAIELFDFDADAGDGPGIRKERNPVLQAVPRLYYSDDDHRRLCGRRFYYTVSDYRQ